MTRLSCPALLLGWFSSCHLFRSSSSYKASSLELALTGLWSPGNGEVLALYVS